MNYVLLVYEIVPEETKFFLIPQEDADEKLLTSCQGLMVNINDLTDEQWENINKLELDIDSGEYHKYLYNKYETNKYEPIRMQTGDSIVAVYNCGFYM